MKTVRKPMRHWSWGEIMKFLAGTFITILSWYILVLVVNLIVRFLISAINNGGDWGFNATASHGGVIAASVALGLFTVVFLECDRPRWTIQLFERYTRSMKSAWKHGLRR